MTVPKVPTNSEIFSAAADRPFTTTLPGDLWRDPGGGVDGPTAIDDELTGLVRSLAAAPDRDALGPHLDRLAALAREHASALQLLLATVVEKRLAEVSVRKVFLDEDRVDDAVQETVLAVAGAIDGFRGDAAFLTWLDRVALNAARQIRRRGQRLSEPVSNEVPEVAWSRRVSSMVANEVVVTRAFGLLSPEHQQVIRLREMDGRSYDEISAELDLPVGTVRSRLNRARADLADRLIELQRSGV